MSCHGWKNVLAAGCLMALVAGCQVPPAPPPTSQGQTDVEEGWLYRRLTGAPPPNGVRQASGLDPASPEPGLADQGTIVPPAGAPDPKSSPREDDAGFDWSDLYPSTIYKNLKVAVGLGPDEKIARAAYQEGLDLFRQKKYAEAAKKFSTTIDRWPDTPLEEDAMFMLGECYFFADRYPKALDAYGKLLNKHEYSRYLDKVVARQFAIGRYWEQMDAYEPHWPITANFVDNTRPLFDTWGNAIKAYEGVRLNDPTGPLADDAVMATANARFLRGHYEDAAYHYDLLRKEYPKSEHQVQACLLGMKSKLLMYQGPMYDGKPLEEAAEIADLALTQFPERLGAERDRIVQAKNQTVEQMAEREWAMGQYYDRRGYYAAARYYYQALIQQYPHTQVAQSARARMEEIKDKPATPPNYFEWVDRALPSKRRR